MIQHLETMVFPLSMVSRKSKNSFSSYPNSSSGMVEFTIVGGKKGKVKVDGVWWSAKSMTGSTIKKGQRIRVVDRVGITLIVIPDNIDFQRVKSIFRSS